MTFNKSNRLPDNPSKLYNYIVLELFIKYGENLTRKQVICFTKSQQKKHRTFQTTDLKFRVVTELKKRGVKRLRNETTILDVSGM